MPRCWLRPSIGDAMSWTILAFFATRDCLFKLQNAVRLGGEIPGMNVGQICSFHLFHSCLFRCANTYRTILLVDICVRIVSMR